MTKEDAYARLNISDGSHSSITMRKILDGFLENNVCIHKGVNRHPYADVFHKGIEGEALQWSDDGIHWYDVVPALYKYRIKPTEPVYEYMWYTDVGETLWMTDDEAESKDEYWNRANETKRVRQ